MILCIKDMTTVSSKILVELELRNLGIKYIKIGNGIVETTDDLTISQMEEFRQKLLRLDLELVVNNKNILTERIKNEIYEMIRLSNELPKVNYSDYLIEKLNYDYTYMANVFIEITGITIRKFIITHRIEKVKQFIMSDELSLTEISNKLNYSSIGHLSNQFKKVTGITPTGFKKLKS